jgi:phospholipid transport system substrate-binding protein
VRGRFERLDVAWEPCRILSGTHMNTNRSAKTLLSFCLGLFAFIALFASGTARADDGAQTYLEAQHQKVNALLHQPASASRDAQVSAILDQMIDYSELARRTFGQPCPAAVPSCTNHWNDLTDAQKAEVTGLLKKLVSRNYQKNLIKTLDYDIAYKGNQVEGGATRVRTEASSKLKPRDPPIQIDYVMVAGGGSYRVVDVFTEGSSLTKNYYDQFHRMLTTADQGYAYIVKKLNDKIAQL